MKTKLNSPAIIKQVRQDYPRISHLSDKFKKLAINIAQENDFSATEYCQLALT